MIKRFLIILVLIFYLPNLSIADDIRDFQIEGMSIGDSLLDYYSEEKIKEGIRYDYYKSDKFLKVEFWRVNLENYDVFSAHVKSNDSRYITYEISGATLYDENIKNCYPKKKKFSMKYLQFFQMLNIMTREGKPILQTPSLPTIDLILTYPREVQLI